MRRLPTALAPLLAVAVAACGAVEDAGPAGGGEPLTVYAGRPEAALGPLLARFERETGIPVEARFDDAGVLLHRLAEEGDGTDADAVVLPTAGALGAAEAAGLLSPLPPSVLARVGARARSRTGRWVGTSVREHVLAYATRRVRRRAVPASAFALTAPRWRARVALAPPDAAMQEAVGALRLRAGEQRTRAWLQALRANEPLLVEDDAQAVEALAAGDADVALVTRAAVRAARARRPDLPVAVRPLRTRAPLLAGAGVVDGAGEGAQARRLVAFLLSAGAQRDARERLLERPLAGARVPAGPVDARDLGAQYERARALLNEVGFPV